MALASCFPAVLLRARVTRACPSTIPWMVPLPRWGRNGGGRPRGGFGFCIISPAGATCGRRRRWWGCRGSRPTCCGGGTGLLRRRGRRRWCWRGGMSRKCWRRGLWTGWRSRSSITASRWRCGGAMTRGCCWRIWRGSTGRWRRARGLRGSASATWRSGSTRCSPAWRGRGRTSCSRCRGGRRRCCLRRAGSMPRRRGPCCRTRRTGRGAGPSRGARRGRRTSRCLTSPSGARPRRGTGMAGATARKGWSMRCWRRRPEPGARTRARICRRWSSSRWQAVRGTAFSVQDRVKRVKSNRAGNPMGPARLS